MFVLNPERVKFGSAVWGNVVSVKIDSETVAPVEEWGESGPWCVLVDSPRRRVKIEVKQELHGVADGLAPATIGSEAQLRVHVSPTGSNAGRKRVKVQAVVVSVSHERRVGAAPVRTIELRGVSASGSADPVSIESAEVGE